MILFIRKVLILIGIILLLLTVVGGGSIVYFSYQFIKGIWLTDILQYVLCMLAYGIAQFLVGFMGIICICIGIDYHR